MAYPSAFSQEGPCPGSTDAAAGTGWTLREAFSCRELNDAADIGSGRSVVKLRAAPREPRSKSLAARAPTSLSCAAGKADRSRSMLVRPRARRQRESPRSVPSLAYRGADRFASRAQRRESGSRGHRRLRSSRGVERVRTIPLRFRVTPRLACPSWRWIRSSRGSGLEHRQGTDLDPASRIWLPQAYEA